MSVVMMIDNPYGSQEIYERASAGMNLPLGGSVHVAGPGPQGGWRVIEGWESEEQARRFAQGPARLNGQDLATLLGKNVESSPIQTNTPMNKPLA